MLDVERTTGLEYGTRPSLTDENNQHVITGVKFVDKLDPFHIWTNLVLLEVCDPHEISLHE